MSDIEREQYTVSPGNGPDEQQDNVSKRDSKADVLAHDVKDREHFERRTTLIILAAAMFLLVSSFSALAYGLRHVNQVADQNSRVICGLAQGYQEQLQENKDFVAANPEGGVFFGVKFTRNDLDQQRLRIQTRLDDISDVDC